METTTTTLPHLPHELMIQILLWLPVKSLIRFKSVCKSWFSLISTDSQFAKSHFQLSAATHTRRVLLISTSAFESIDLEASLHDDSAFASLDFDFLPIGSYSDLQIKGSCRGFILLHCSLSFYIWNPSTGFHKKIPLSPFECDSDKECEYFYGFGYDSSTDDYLVVSMSAHLHTCHLEIFSLRANTWRQIQGPHCMYAHASEHELKPGLFFNGAIYWLAFRLDLLKHVILAYDLIERKFFHMAVPYKLKHTPYDCGLWVFGEFLGLWVHHVAAEIWVMKVHKVHLSWTRTHVFPFDGIQHPFSPLCSAKKGHIIGTDDPNRLVRYNHGGKLLECSSYYNESYGPKVAVYTESLLSLPGDNQQA